MNGPGTTAAFRSAIQSCLACGIADPPRSMTCTLGRDHRVGAASGCPAYLRLTAACAARPCSARRVGWRTGVRCEVPRRQPQELTRARAAVAAWRSQNPGGTSEELVAAIGQQFHPDYGVVLRALLFAADRHQAQVITGNAGPGRDR